MNCNLRCVLCEVCPVEMTVHLFFECQFARNVWARLGQLAMVNFRAINLMDGEIEDIWESFVS